MKGFDLYIIDPIGMACGNEPRAQIGFTLHFSIVPEVSAEKFLDELK